MTSDEYLQKRLDNQISWYSSRSMWNQKWYKWLRIIEIAFAITIPFLIGQITNETEVLKLIVGAMGVCVAIISGLVTLFKFQENWIEYRTTAETLKHEKYFYITNTAPYDGDNPFEVLVNRVESLISRENTNWARIIKSKEKEKNNG